MISMWVYKDIFMKAMHVMHVIQLEAAAVSIMIYQDFR
jgi:hypothetical protein